MSKKNKHIFEHKAVPIESPLLQGKEALDTLF